MLRSFQYGVRLATANLPMWPLHIQRWVVKTQQSTYCTLKSKYSSKSNNMKVLMLLLQQHICSLTYTDHTHEHHNFNSVKLTMIPAWQTYLTAECLHWHRKYCCVCLPWSPWKPAPPQCILEYLSLSLRKPPWSPFWYRHTMPAKTCGQQITDWHVDTVPYRVISTI